MAKWLAARMDNGWPMVEDWWGRGKTTASCGVSWQIAEYYVAMRICCVRRLANQRELRTVSQWGLWCQTNEVKGGLSHSEDYGGRLTRTKEAGLFNNEDYGGTPARMKEDFVTARILVAEEREKEGLILSRLSEDYRNRPIRKKESCTTMRIMVEGQGQGMIVPQKRLSGHQPGRRRTMPKWVIWWTTSQDEGGLCHKGDSGERSTRTKGDCASQDGGLSHKKDFGGQSARMKKDYATLRILVVDRWGRRRTIKQWGLRWQTNEDYTTMRIIVEDRRVQKRTTPQWK